MRVRVRERGRVRVRVRVREREREGEDNGEVASQVAWGPGCVGGCCH